jgi:hypothetical protein
MSEMWVPIIVALITSGLTLVGVIIANRRSNADMVEQIRRDSEVQDVKLQGRIDVIHQTISDLTKQVEKHNQVIERTYGLERRMSLAEERIDVLRGDTK